MKAGKEEDVGEDQIIQNLDKSDANVMEMVITHSKPLKQTVMLQLWRRACNYSSKAKTTTPTLIKLINSHEQVESKEVANNANMKRIKELQVYQRESAQVRRSHAAFAQQFPTKTEREKNEKAERTVKREATWSKYVEGLKKCMNPDVGELQEAGKIRKIDFDRRTIKAERGQTNLTKSLKPAVLMRRKYLNYLSTSTIPTLVTPSNLDAKIQEALDNPVNYNLSGEGVVEGVKGVKQKLREIRVPMEEYEDKQDININSANRVSS